VRQKTKWKNSRPGSIKNREKKGKSEFPQVGEEKRPQPNQYPSFDRVGGGFVVTKRNQLCGGGQQKKKEKKRNGVRQSLDKTSPPCPVDAGGDCKKESRRLKVKKMGGNLKGRKTTQHGKKRQKSLCENCRGFV